MELSGIRRFLIVLKKTATGILGDFAIFDREKPV